MSINIRNITLIVSAAITLSACVTTQYKYNNQNYASRDEAMAAAARKDAEIEASIAGGTTPLVDRKLLIVIPTANAMIRTLEAKVTKEGKTRHPAGTPARAQDDFLIDTHVMNMKSLASSVRKANIYKSTEIIDVDTTEPNIVPTKDQDIYIMYFIGVESAGMSQYLLRDSIGKQLISVDAAANQAGRRKSIIDDIRTKALQ